MNPNWLHCRILEEIRRVGGRFGGRNDAGEREVIHQIANPAAQRSYARIWINAFERRVCREGGHHGKQGETAAEGGWRGWTVGTAGPAAGCAIDPFAPARRSYRGRRVLVLVVVVPLR